MSTSARIYLDHHATSPLVPAAREAMARALDSHGNPSSIHAEGRAARDVVERARDAIAGLFGRPREGVVLTSGGTEGNALGVLGLALAVERAGGPRIVITSAIEHPSLRGAVDALAVRGWTTEVLPVDGEGRIDPATPSLRGAGLVALAVVNHELGTLVDVAAVAREARSGGALIHLDAVQAAGKLALWTLDADSIAISAHKLGGPPGVGALFASSHLDAALPIVGGGQQERGRRAGTENVVGIAGFGAAAAAVDLPSWAGVTARGAELEEAIVRLPGARIHGARAPRVGGTVNAGFEGALGESIVIGLDLAGIAASTGAACTSGSTQPSPVLLALGLTPGAAREGVRFSLGRSTTGEELAVVVAQLATIVDRVRAALER